MANHGTLTSRVVISPRNLQVPVLSHPIQIKLRALNLSTSEKASDINGYRSVVPGGFRDNQQL